MIILDALIARRRARQAEKAKWKAGDIEEHLGVEWTHEDLAPLLSEVQKTHNQRGRARRRILRSIRVAKVPQPGKHRRGAA